LQFVPEDFAMGKSRWLFRLACGVALCLVLLVLTAPLLDTGNAEAEGWHRLVFLFAHDATLRRTCLASAVGLLVTACVFFQPAVGFEAQVPPPRKRQSGIAGA
jgi:hypothetical protein